MQEFKVGVRLARRVPEADDGEAGCLKDVTRGAGPEAGCGCMWLGGFREQVIGEGC